MAVSAEVVLQVVTAVEAANSGNCVTAAERALIKSRLESIGITHASRKSINCNWSGF